MHKSRFPGKSVNKHPKREVSYNNYYSAGPPRFSADNSTQPQVASEYRDSMARLAAELPELRQKFGITVLENFHGFSPDDGIQSACKKKCTEISSIVEQLETKSSEGKKDLLTKPSSTIASAENEKISEVKPFAEFNEDPPALPAPKKVKGAANGNGKSSKIKRKRSTEDIYKPKPEKRLVKKRKRNPSNSKVSVTEAKVKKTEIGSNSSTKVVEFSGPFKTPVKDPRNLPETAVKMMTNIIFSELVSKTGIQSAVTEVVPANCNVHKKISCVKRLSMNVKQKIASSVTAVQPVIALDFFKDKEDYASAVMVFVSSKLQDVEQCETFVPQCGWIQCGVCLDMKESSSLSQQKVHGVFMCTNCIQFLKLMIEIAEKNEPYSCKAKGACDIVPNEDYCEACFVRNCLLSLDLKDEVYFKMWRSVPPQARNYVPTKPPLVKRYPNRGKVLLVDFKTGVIVKTFQYHKITSEDGNDGIEIKKEPELKADLKYVRKEIAGTSSSTDTASSQEDETEKAVRAVCPSHLYEAEEFGYAVVVADSDRENPPKALCFVCGSAGIRQLIFCGGCCEPFHPYCSEDKLLLSAFIAELTEENSSLNGGLLNGSSSRLNKFRKWRCYRCTLCKMCNTGRVSSSDRIIAGTKDATNSKMIKCGACLDSYHYSCARKVTSVGISKPLDITKWICHNCMKCTSCGIKLSKSLQQHYRKLSTESCKNNEEREALCLECFRRRKKGSYCPVCYVCYDDNDWDSKMMECEKCLMWVHSRCEGLSDEKYSVLSFLPEGIPYICRLCSPFECEVGWRQAVKNDISDGFSRVLGFFQKKTVGMSRKRRALTFDEDNEGFKREDTNVNLTPGDTSNITVKVESIASEISQGANTSDPPILSDSIKPPEDKNTSPSPTKSIQDCDTQNKLSNKKSSGEVEENHYFKYSKLIKVHKIRECSILLKDLDQSKIKHGKKRRSSPRFCQNSLTGSSDNVEYSNESPADVPEKRVPDMHEESPLEPSEIIHSTPKKIANGGDGASLGSCTTLWSFDFLTPSKLSTPTRVVVSFTDAVRKAADLDPDMSLCTVAEFYRLCMRLIPTYFQEVDNSLGTERYKDFFKDAMKEVFPWFDTSQAEESIVNLPISSADQDSTAKAEEQEDTKVEEDAEQVITNGRRGSQTSDQSVSHDCILFEDLYWNLTNFMDYRVCAFCTETGDFPTHLCGRLLYAGPEEWVHVNCALWSSEVWEEDAGGLQQVEVALARGKRTKCNYCEQPGATLTCCAGSCKRCFHFLCAIRAGCFMMEDKTLFCPSHEMNAKGSVQKDMHVNRKVFVDLAASRKKDVKVSSKKLTVYVGSLRVLSLGHVIPISVRGSSTYLVPVDYASQRIYWSTQAEESLMSYTTRSSLNTEGDFRSYFENLKDVKKEPFNVTINHSYRKELKKRLHEHGQFIKWMQIVPVYVDEYEISWEMPCLPVVMQSYIKGTGLMQNGLKKYFSEKVHRARIDLKLNSEEYSVDSSSATGSEVARCPQNVYTALTQNPSILSDPRSSSEEYFEFMDKMGFIHPAIKFIMEQLPGIESVVGRYRFLHGYPLVAAEDVPVKVLMAGSARAEGSHVRKPFDRFGWLASQHRNVPLPKLNFEETVKCKGLPIAMRFRNLKERANQDLVVLPSDIHGRGLFARRDIEVGEMLIEYAGEVIRSSLCDMREKKYENEGMGCYMFRINSDLVVDATMKGNAARFINHSCDPNCESKCVKILGKDHILILALKNIGRGEELTYDYKFERESDKLPCSCKSKKCRKFLN